MIRPLGFLLLVSHLALGCAVGTSVDQKLQDPDGGAAAAQQSSSPCAQPDTPAACSACGTGKVCQPNGCYNGYLCDTDTNRCKAPDACP